MAPDLTLHYHPFASFCQKALVAFAERDVPFSPVHINGPEDRERLAQLWPMAKMPVLVDGATGEVVPDSTSVIEYVDALAEGGPILVPTDPAAARHVRFWDRFLDAYVEIPMQKTVADVLRDEADRDPFGVAEARAALDQAYGVLEGQVAGKAWLAGDDFTLADCGAGPALFYAWVMHPWDVAKHPELTRYYAALMARPSIDEVIEGGRFFREYFPPGWPAHADDHRPAGRAHA